MKVYEFWLKEQFKAQSFDELCDNFYNLGNIMNRWDNPKDENGDPLNASVVYAVSKNPDTHWVQLLVDDNTPHGLIIAIEAKINGLRDDEPFRKYDDEEDNYSPIETPKHFTLERVLRVRQKQKDEMLGRVEDVQ